MVGIASVYFQHNYGSMLQAYATQAVLDKYGIENETINISGFSNEIKKKKIIYFIRASLTTTILRDKIGMVRFRILKKLPMLSLHQNMRIRDKKFNEFESNFRLSERNISIDILNKYVEKKYSTVIVGSDQLWLPGNISGDYFTLNFVPDKIRKISYATSFGQTTLPLDIAKKAKRFLKRIDFISVRESSGKGLIHDLIGRDVDVVCDPVLLLSANDWMEIQKKEAIVKHSYRT